MRGFACTVFMLLYKDGNQELLLAMSLFLSQFIT
jgi:hypothetical protein